MIGASRSPTQCQVLRIDPGTGYVYSYSYGPCVLQSHEIRNAVRSVAPELALAAVLCADRWMVEEDPKGQHEGRGLGNGNRGLDIDGWSGEQENILSTDCWIGLDPTQSTCRGVAIGRRKTGIG